LKSASERSQGIPAESEHCERIGAKRKEPLVWLGS
jgi:hypothetical protein